jgi:hypothetical protein
MHQSTQATDLDNALFEALVVAGTAIEPDSPEIAIIQGGIALAVAKGATLKELEEFLQATLTEAFLRSEQ